MKISADISNWAAGQKHHIAAAWRLNSQDHRDEMHLFIDGFETPNILRYGGRPTSVATDRFRTIKPEITGGTIPNNIINGTDLQTSFGSNIVSSSYVNFSIQGIVPGNQLQINEPNFSTYTIIAVNGNNLTLNASMPSSFTNANFLSIRIVL